MKQDVLDFINWMFIPKNRFFVKKSSPNRVAKIYEEETGNKITHNLVIYHRNKWLLIDNEPYEIAKTPKFILENQEFKDFAKTHNIVIETMDDDEQSSTIKKETEVENINGNEQSSIVHENINDNKQ